MVGTRGGSGSIAVIILLAFALSSGFIVAIDAGTAATDTEGVTESSTNSTALADNEPVGPITTEYFEIWYYAGYESGAEAIAAYADEQFEVLFQKFGVEPDAERQTVVIGDLSEIPCEGTGVEGCYTGDGELYVTSDDPSLFYHELTHYYQDVAGISQPGRIAPLELVIEGTARYLDSSDDQIASRATFSFDPDEYFTNRDASFDEYDDLALFAEFVLDEYGREAFDVLYTEYWGLAGENTALEEAAEEDIQTIQEQFLNQLSDQQQRMQSSESVLPAFTYEPFVIYPDDEVTFDATTPSVIEEIDRAWYPTAPSSYEWDLTGDGEIDETGPTASISDPAEEVSLYVTVDGETHEATQELLVAEPALSFADPAVDQTTVDDDEPVTVETTVENTGDDPGTEELELRVDGERIEQREVDVPAGEAVDVNFEHEFDDAGSYELTLNGEPVEEIQVRGPAETSLVETGMQSDSFETGEEIVVEAIAENTGGSTGEVTIEIQGDEQPLLLLFRENIIVDGGEVVTEEIEIHSGLDPGAYELEIEGEPVEFTVFDPGTVTVSDATATPETVSVGEQVTIEGTVENTGEQTADTSIQIRLHGGQATEHELTLDPGEQSTVSEQHTFQEPGTQTVSVGDSEITVLVEEETDDQTGDDGETDDHQATDDQTSEDGETDDGDLPDSDDNQTGESDTQTGDDDQTALPGEFEDEDGQSDDGFGAGFTVIGTVLALLLFGVVVRRRPADGPGATDI